MSATAALRAAATGTAPAAAEPKALTVLTSDAFKQQLAAALPKHMTADRMARIALTEIRRVPKLLDADQASLFGSIMQAAQLGLEIGAGLGHCYLIPFDKSYKDGNAWKKRTEAQLIIGYRGMIDLARRSGQIQSIDVRAVYEHDEFHVDFGLNPDLKHKPAWDRADRGRLAFVYAVARFKDGGYQFEVMSRAEVEGIRARSKSKDNGPWVTDFDEMSKKTVVRRLFKYLPVSIELQRAVALDELVDAGVSQNTGLLLDGEFKKLAQQTEERAALESHELTAQEVHDAIAAAATVEALNDAGDLIRALPVDEHAALTALYTLRLDELAPPAKESGPAPEPERRRAKSETPAV